MVSVRIDTPLTGVAIGGKNDEKEVAVRHWIREVHNVSDVTTMCGAKIAALPSTWQQTRPCRRCIDSGVLNQARDVTFRLGWAWQESHEFHGEWEKRRLLHGFQVIKNCGSKRKARKVAVALGWENPDLLKYDHPELAQFVTYIRKPKNAR